MGYSVGTSASLHSLEFCFLHSNTSFQLAFLYINKFYVLDKTVFFTLKNVQVLCDHWLLLRPIHWFRWCLLLVLLFIDSYLSFCGSANSCCFLLDPLKLISLLVLDTELSFLYEFVLTKVLVKLISLDSGNIRTGCIFYSKKAENL